jgi:hypothetical protein
VGTHELRSDEDIEEILKMALEEVPAGEDGDMRARLMACAAELDLTPDQVAAAEERWTRQEAERRDLEEFKQHQRKVLFGGFFAFAIVDALIVTINLLIDHRVGWALWLIAASLIVMASMAWVALSPNNALFQDDFKRWRKKRSLDELPGKVDP